MNFPCYEAGQRITADATAAAVALEGNAGRVMSARDILLWNPGPLDVQVLCGNAGSVADADCAPLPAGAVWSYGKGPTTHLSAYCAAGSQEIVALLGEGS